MSDWTELKRLAESVPDNYSNETAQYVIFSDAADPQAILALIAENERLSRFEEAYKEWIDKTEWVQDSAAAKDLGKHRADVMNERINQLRAEIEELKKESAWVASGCDYDHGIHHNPDAKAWADLFVATFPGLSDKHDLMLGWFANAMMAMHDFLAQRDNSELEGLRKDAERYRWLRTYAHGAMGYVELEDLFSYNDSIIDEKVDDLRKEPRNG